MPFLRPSHGRTGKAADGSWGGTRNGCIGVSSKTLMNSPSRLSRSITAFGGGRSTGVGIHRAGAVQKRPPRRDGVNRGGGWVAPVMGAQANTIAGHMNVPVVGANRGATGSPSRCRRRPGAGDRSQALRLSRAFGRRLLYPHLRQRSARPGLRELHRIQIRVSNRRSSALSNVAIPLDYRRSD